MAITQTYKMAAQGGVEVSVPVAYYRISSFSGDKYKINVKVYIYKDADSTSGEPMEIKFYQIPLDINGANFIKQAYAHLKTLPEFADSTDV
jgi:hypothetical protein